MGFYTLIILWVLSPLALLPLTIIYYLKYDKAKKLCASYEKMLANIQQNNGAQQPTAPVVRQPIEQPPIATPPVPVVPQSPPNAPAPQKVPTGVPRSAPKKKEQTAFGVLNITFMAGVLLVLVAGLIFATTSWRILPDLGKVIIIFCFVAIFFATSVLAEKKFKLRMTGITFYHLGCFFLPLAVLAVGYFGLLGSWFTLVGSGASLVQLCMGLTFGVATYMGFRIYGMPSFYYASLACSIYFVLMLSRCLGGDWRQSVLVVLLYGTALVSWLILKKGRKFLLPFHPFLVLSCVLQTALLFTNVQLQLGVFGLLSLLCFFAYLYSEKCMPFSFETPYGNHLFPVALFFATVLGFCNGAFFLCLTLGFATIVSVAMLFLRAQSNPIKNIYAYAIMTIIGLMQLPFVLAITPVFPISKTDAFVISYCFMAIVFLLGYLGKIPPKHAPYFDLPSNLLMGILGAFSFFFFRFDHQMIWILWVLFLLWLLQRKRPIFLLSEASFGLFLPSLTLYTFLPQTPLAVYALLVCATALGYGALSKKYPLLHQVSIIGLILGFPSFLFYFTSTNLAPIYGLAMLLLMILGNCLGYFRKKTMSYGWMNLALPFLVSPMVERHLMGLADLAPLMALATGFLLLCIGKLLFPKVYEKNTYIDTLSLAAFFACLPAIFTGERLWIFIAFVYLLLPFGNLYWKQKEQQPLALCGGMSALALGWLFQPFSLAEPMLWFVFGCMGFGYTLLADRKKEKDTIYQILRFSGMGLFYGGFSLTIVNCYFAVYSPLYAVAILAVIILQNIREYKKQGLPYHSLMSLWIIPLVLQITQGLTPLWLPKAVGLGAGVVLLVLGRTLFPALWKFDGEKKQLQWDYCSFFALPAVLTGFWSSNPYLPFASVLLLILFWANLYGRQNQQINHIAFIGALCFGYLAWTIQPFFPLPSLFTLEYQLLGLGIVTVLAHRLWKEEKKALEIFTLVVVILSILLQAGSCILQNNLTDVLFLGVAMVLLLGIAYWKKRLRWLLLSIVTLLLLVLYISKAFWLSLAWWIYLLLAGMLLISIAAYSEYRKKEEHQKKDHGLLEHWNW